MKKPPINSKVDAILYDTRHTRLGTHITTCKQLDCEGCCNDVEQCCLINRSFFTWYRILQMPSKKRSGPKNFPTTEFVQYRLDKDERKSCETWTSKNLADEDNLVVEVLSANHKISFSFDGNNDTFICSFTGKADDCNNASKCLTSRGPTTKIALWACLYKYHVIFQRGVWEGQEPDSDWG